MRRSTLRDTLRDGALIAVVLVGSAAGALVVGAAAQGGDAAPGPEIARVVQVEMGDVACYLQLETMDGDETSSLAAFDLCREDLVGRRARLSYESVDVAAASCEGDPTCRDTETRSMVIAADPLDD